MQKNIFTQKNYTIYGYGYQLKLPLNIECMIPVNDSVRLLSQFIEEMDITDIYKTYSRVRENQASPRQLLKIMIYAYMEHFFASRSIEKECNRNINFMYLLDGAPAPDHSTIARFRSIHFAPVAEKILAQVTKFLKQIGEISADAIFIDGTKFEAAANKYTFVWKKTVTKNLQKMMDKIPEFVAECEEMYGIKIIYQEKVELYHLKKLLKKLLKIKEDENITFVHGIGKRKTPLQKSYEKLEEYIERLKKYSKDLEIMGNRNSYSKTDPDATFMRMKEDAMKNGQLKPAYNVQFGVDAEYIAWISVGPQPTDTTTLIPFLKDAEKHLGFKYQKIVADAGYESEENYVFIENNDQLSFIKPSNYEISKTKKYKSDISRMENMEYVEDGDYYICKNGKRLVVTGTRTDKSKTGYKSEKTCYTCEDCTNCSYKGKCIKGNNSKTTLEDRTKRLEVSKLFKEKRKANLERILSDEGCELRINRSIQSEGSFGEVKQNMGFRRFLCKGKQNVLAECILLGIAHNINKLHNKIQTDRCGVYLHTLNKSA